MATWCFEPGHTAARFRARHMMVTYVRGHFKNVSGSLGRFTTVELVLRSSLDDSQRSRDYYWKMPTLPGQIVTRYRDVTP